MRVGRPKGADGTRFGDRKTDLVIGKEGYGAILVLAERNTSYCIIEKLPHGKNAKEIAKAAIRLLYAYRLTGVLTITTDNGSEFSAHQQITKSLKGVVVYFTDSFCSWQKGLVESQTSLSANTFLKELILTLLRTDSSRKYRQNSIEDQERNSISRPLPLSFSNIFDNIAFALGLYGLFTINDNITFG